MSELSDVLLLVGFNVLRFRNLFLSENDYFLMLKSLADFMFDLTEGTSVSSDELEEIIQVFKNIMKSVHHVRIEYPEEQKKKKEAFEYITVTTHANRDDRVLLLCNAQDLLKDH